MKKFFALAAVTALASCQANKDNAADGNSTTDAVPVNMEESVEDTGDVEQTASGDIWSVDDQVDQMTDARVITASTKVLGSSKDIQVQVRCIPANGDLRYFISGYDKEGEGATLASEYFNGTTRNAVQWRADEGRATIAFNPNPQYGNQTVLVHFPEFHSQGPTNALKLLLRLQFSDTNETFVVDQDTEAFRAAVRPCLDVRAEAERKVEAERDAERQRADELDARHKAEADERARVRATDPNAPPADPTFP